MIDSDIVLSVFEREKDLPVYRLRTLSGGERHKDIAFEFGADICGILNVIFTPENKDALRAVYPTLPHDHPYNVVEYPLVESDLCKVESWLYHLFKISLELDDCFTPSNISAVISALLWTIPKHQIFYQTQGDPKSYGGGGGLVDSGNAGEGLTADSMKRFLAYAKRAQKCTSYHCESLQDVVFASIYHTVSMGYTFKRCDHCGKWFIPKKKNDERLCSGQSPLYPNKTCKEGHKLAEQSRRNMENTSKGQAGRKYKSIYVNLTQRLDRAEAGSEKYNSIWEERERFREKAGEWKDKIKAGSATWENYIEWLLTHQQGRKKGKNGNG